MEYSEIIYLITNELKEDEIGNINSSFDLYNKCYAKKQSVRTSEFYNATMVGMNPSVEFVIKKLNYSGESELLWNDERYEVLRVVEPKNKFDIVLVCSKKIGVYGNS
jgi:hypothetical protein